MINVHMIIMLTSWDHHRSCSHSKLKEFIIYHDMEAKELPSLLELSLSTQNLFNKTCTA